MAQRPVVLVTGGARRIGRAIALELGRTGWDVAVHYRASAAEAQETVTALQASGSRAEAFAADVKQRTNGQVEVQLYGSEQLAKAAENFPQVARGTIEAAMSVNFQWGTTIPEMSGARGADGCVVNLLDQKLANPNPDYFSYTLSKAALDAATTMLAQALAPRVRVCGVAPGVTLVSGAMSDEEFARARRLTPLQRSSTLDDLARAVRFLLESPAITGTTLMVDGGQHLQHQPRDVMFLARGQKD